LVSGPRLTLLAQQQGGCKVMKFNQPTTRNMQKGIKNEDEEKKKKKYEQK
jgi:hypothetical protein